MKDLRPEYSPADALDEATVDRDPLQLFQRWLDEAIAAGIRLAEAMTLATATPEGKPSARLVLLKQADDLVDKVKDDRVKLHFKLRRSDLFKDISPADAEWIGARLSRLSDRQIADAFRAANYDPEEVAALAQTVRDRIDVLVHLTQ